MGFDSKFEILCDNEWSKSRSWGRCSWSYYSIFNPLIEAQPNYDQGIKLSIVSNKQNGLLASTSQKFPRLWGCY